MVATLSFGFWDSMLAGRYNPLLWSRHLATSFPDLPRGVDRDALKRRSSAVLNLRNRISHHEPLIRLDLRQQDDDILDMVAWICPQTRIWMEPHLTLPGVLSSRPWPLTSSSG